MIKINRFYSNEKALRKSFDDEKNKLLAKLTPSATNYVPEWERRELQSQYDGLTFAAWRSSQLEKAKVDEIWLNPKEIKKIEVKRTFHTDERFLEIYMNDGSSYCAEGESVQEFFLRNVIFGEDVDA